jgi:hypothetical protein
MVGEQQDPEREQRRLEHGRKAIAMLNGHVIENGPGEMTQQLLLSWLREDLAEVDLGGRVPDEIDEEGAVARTALRLSTGMTYVAWELLAMREAETGKTPAETLEELGRIFNPPSE